VIINGGTAGSIVAGGKSTNSGVDYYTEGQCTVSNNSVTLISGKVGNVLNGGVSHSGNAVSNKVNIQGGTVGNMVYGGDSDYGSANSNEVIISGGKVSNSVKGGDAKMEANNNTVTISGDAVVVGNCVYGGNSDNGTAANGNTVNISNGSSSGNTIYGGCVDNYYDTEYAIQQQGKQYHFSKGKRTANNNTVNISGGDVGYNVYGGYVYAYNTSYKTHDVFEIKGNTVNISGGNFKSTNVYAASASTNDGIVTGNKITLTSTSKKAPNLSGATLYGSNQTSTALVTGDNANKLDLTDMAVALTAKSISNFNEIIFGADTATLTTSAGGNLAYTTIDATAITSVDGERILLQSTGDDFTNTSTAVLNISSDLKGGMNKVAVGDESGVSYVGYVGSIEAKKVSIKASDDGHIAGVYYTSDGKGYAIDGEDKLIDNATVGMLTISSDLTTTGKVYTGAYAEDTKNATGGIVDITAGALTGDVYAGYSVGGVVTGNKIVVEDGVNLSEAQLHGSNKNITAQAEKGKENILDLSACSTSVVKSIDNFDLIELGTGILTVGTFSKNYLTIKGGTLKFAGTNNTEVAVGENLTLQGVDVTGKIKVNGGVLNVGEDTVFKNLTNAEGSAAAIYSTGDSVLNIDGATFEGNTAKWFGAITTGTSNVQKSTIANTTFKNNSAEEVGALGLFKVTDIINTTFTGNKATSTADSSDGAGALFLGAESVVSITGSTFTGNESAKMGGAISTRKPPKGNNKDAKLDIINSTFTGNTAATNGGAIDNHLMHSAALNGQENDAVYVKNSTFTSNSADNGGAIYNNDVDNASNKVAMYISGGTFTGNTATTAGGAIYNKGILFVDDTFFSGNTANGKANDIYNEGTITFTGGTSNLDGGIMSVSGSVINVAKGANVALEGSKAKLDLAGTLNIKGGILTAGSFNFINAQFATINDMATKVVFSDNGLLCMDVNGAEYTATNVKSVKEAFVTGTESGDVAFINGKMKTEEGEALVARSLVQNSEATLSDKSAKVVNEQSVSSDIASVVEVTDSRVDIVDNASSGVKLVDGVAVINVPATTLATQGFNIASIKEGFDKVQLNIKENSNIALTGTDDTDSTAIWQTKDGGSNVSTDLNVTNSNVDLGIAGGEVSKQNITLNNVVFKKSEVNVQDSNVTVEGDEGMTLNDSTLNVAGKGVLNVDKVTVTSDDTTNITNSVITGILATKELIVEDGKKAVLNIGDDSAAANVTVDKINLNKGVLITDPAWKVDGTDTVADASELATNTTDLDGTFVAGRNSIIAFGTTDTEKARNVFEESQLTWGKNNVTAAAYVEEPINVVKGALVVDGSMTTAPQASVDGTVNFAANSILMVDGTACRSTAAISGVKNLNVDSTSKLYITNGVAGSTYKILASTINAIGVGSAWDSDNIKSNLTTYVAEVAYDEDNNNYFIVTLGESQYHFEDTVAPNTFETMKNAKEGSAPSQYIYNLLDYEGITGDHAGMVRELNRNANMPEELGVMHDHFTVTNMTEDAVAQHLAADTHKQGKEVWAQGIHSKEDVSGLGLDVQGNNYETQYNGAIVGVDLVDDGNTTIGAALTYVGGKATAAYGSHNDGKYYGATIYGRTKLAENSGLQYDVSYMHSSNDLLLGSGIGADFITGDQKVNSISVGVRLDQEFTVGKNSSLVPHVGARWLRMKGDSFTNSLGDNYSPDATNSFIVPAGLSFRASVENSGWKMSFLADAGYQWNFGDRYYTQNISYNGAPDRYDVAFADRGNWYTAAGFEFARKNFTAEIGYRYLKSSNTCQNRWNLMLDWKF